MWSPQATTTGKIRTPNAPIKKNFKRHFHWNEEEEAERQQNRRRATEMAMVGYREMMEKYPFPRDIAQTKPGTFFPPKEETERIQNREIVRILLYNDRNIH